MEYGEISIMSLIERYEKMSQDGQLYYLDVEDFESIVSYYLYNNSLDKAQRAINDGMHLHPTSLELKLKLIEVEIKDECWQDALDLIDEVRDIAFSYKAEICMYEARVLLMQQHRVDDVVFMLDDMLTNHINAKDIDLQPIISDFLHLSEYIHAAKYIKLACKYQPGANHLLLDLAYCYDRLEDVKNAIIAYERYLDENPFSALAWFELAKMYERDKQYSNAINAYDFVLTIDPNYTDAYFGKSDLQIAEGWYEQAIKTLKRLLEEDSNNIRANYTLGECYEKQYRLDEALHCYLSIIEYNDAYTDAYYSAAFVLKDMGRVDECIALLKKATYLEPVNNEYYYGLGKVLMEQGQFIEAVEAFENAINNDKYDFESWLLLAELYASTDFDKALSILEDASAYVYDIPEVSYRMAALYFLTSNIDKCVEHFERGVLLDAEKASGFFDLCPTARHEERIMTIYINSKIKNSI